MDVTALPRKRLALSDGAELAYVETGTGPETLVLVHGWSSSLNWWKENIEALSERYRVVACDVRGHGDSDKTESGHTMEQYARDIAEVIEKLCPNGDPVVAGWSMGAFILWNYVLQFGRGRTAGMVFVGQSARDLQSENFPHGIVTHEGMHEWMVALQTDQEAFVRELMKDMRMHAPSEQEYEWMVGDYLRCPAHIATVAFYHQTTVDSLPAFPKIDFPTQVYFGADPKMYKLSDGEYLAEAIPGTELVTFEQSGHIPMIEEPEKFNAELLKFADRLLANA